MTRSWSARDVMQTAVRSIKPDKTLPELEEAFLEARVSGFPVVEKEKLLGIVSRSDVVRQLCVERSLAESLSDYYRDALAFSEDPTESFAEIAGRVGRRIEDLRVGDVMVTALITVSPDTPLDEVARTLVERRIHRVPVTEDGRLVGIVSSLDLVRLLAEKRAVPA